MRRSQLVFVTAVFTAFLTGFFVTRSRSDRALKEADFPELPAPIQFGEIEPPAGFFPLEGTVTRADGGPAADVTILLTADELASGEARPVPLTHTDAQGRFSLERLLDGDYEAILIASGHPTQRIQVHIPRREPVAWSLPPPFGRLPLLPPLLRGSLAGRLAPPVGFPVRFSPVEGYEIAFLPAADEDPLLGAVKRTVLTDAAGMFALPDLVDCDYDVLVLPAWAHGGTWPNLEEQGLRISHRTALDQTQSLGLRLRCGELTGRVVNTEARPIEGALVSVRPAERSDQVWPLKTTDGEGYFRIRDLPPASYVVDVRAGSGSVTEAVNIFVGTRARLDISLNPR